MQTPKNKILLLLAGFFVAFALMAIMPSDKVFAASPCDRKHPTPTSLNNCLKENPIVKDIRMIVRVLSAGAGVVIVGSIIWGGIQYIWAGNNPNAVSAAKNRIQNALIALVAFIFIFAFLNWLIPGGLLVSLGL